MSHQGRVLSLTQYEETFQSTSVTNVASDTQIYWQFTEIVACECGLWHGIWG